MKVMLALTAVFALILAACTSQTAVPSPAPVDPAITPTPELHGLPNLGVAPEIQNEVWVNADTPVTLASQRGKVVLLEFWTFG